MTSPMPCAAVTRRIKRQIKKYDMALVYGMTFYGTESLAGSWSLEDHPRNGCLVDAVIVGEQCKDRRRTGEETNASTMERITGWTPGAVRAAEVGFEDKEENKPTLRRLLPYYQYGQTIRATLGRAA